MRATASWLAVLAAAAFAAGEVPEVDWLTTKISTPATANVTAAGIVLDNGLVRRLFAVQGTGIATVDLWSNASGTSVLRAVGPEALLQLDGSDYRVGGLAQDPNDYSGMPHAFAFLNRSGLALRADAAAFQLAGHAVSSPQAPYPWTPGSRGSDPSTPWPPLGVRLTLSFVPPADVVLPAHAAVRVDVVYELYQGIPLVSKWVEVSLDPAAAAAADGTAPFPLSRGFAAGSVEVSGVVVERLAVNHEWSPVASDPGGTGPQPSGGWAPPGLSAVPGGVNSFWTGRLHVEASVPHVSALSWYLGPQATSDITTGSPGASQPVLNATYALGPGFILTPTAAAAAAAAGAPARWSARSPPPVFESFRVLELLVDTADKERWGLSRRRMVRLLAPATTESPLYLSMTDVSDTGVATAARQAADVGFDMLIYSFGAGFDWENTGAAYRQQIGRQVAGARALGLEVGGYDLICEDRGHGGYGGNVGDQWDVVAAGTGALRTDACFASGWVDRLTNVSDGLLAATNLSAIITDGPYGGAHMACASTGHAHHLGLSDSVYWQTRQQVEFFSALLRRGVYVLQPDSYFYAGAQRAPMGYNEQTWSLPRWTQLQVGRASLYEDLFHYLPSQVWTFIPITQYHAGGASASFEPLSANIAEYEWALAQTLGMGVGGNFRGDQLYDSPAVRDVVANWTAFYKTHRDIVTADVVHLRRPSVQGWDGAMHVGPGLASGRRALAMLFNPTDAHLRPAVRLPLYYAGLTDTAVVAVGARGAAASLPLDRRFGVTVDLPPRSFSWVHVAAPGTAAAAELEARA